MRPVKRAHIVAVLAVFAGFVLAACGNDNKTGGGGGGKPGAGKPPVTIGAKNFTEEFVLGQLYKQGLEAKGFRVKLKNNIGSTELIDKSLTSGQLDMYPEYIGIALTAVAHDNKAYPNAKAAYQAVEAFEEKRGFTLLGMTPYQNVDALAVKPDYAKKNGLVEVGDLKKVGSSATVGAPPEFKTRDTGLKGMADKYGVTKIKFKPLAIGLQYKALDSNKIQVADVFTTDGQLIGNKYTLLKDPKNIFGFQNVAPIVSKKALKAEGPEFQKTIDAISAKLTIPAMQKMNAAVDVNKVSPATVAEKFLKANGLA